MKLPAIVTNSALQSLASEGETHEMHVILRRIANAAPYTLRGRRRQYIVTRDIKRGAHILKVPLSVWMAGCSPDRFAENDSICFDIQSSRTGLKCPLTFEVWPINKPAAVVAPKVIKQEAPASPPAPAQDAPAPLSNAERQKLHRERKKAEKAAELQPA